MEPDYDGNDPWWAVPLFLLLVLIVAPLVLWAGIWLVFCYLDALVWLFRSLPWPVLS